ncbi:TrkH family potassium uptake protein [Insolitispirillum peregrinum]|uniref:TrkH family potassium uptake protein n=1 Tax=Insolitispirillum peregrinum TaxID=80876 RepID=UPI00360FDFFA
MRSFSLKPALYVVGMLIVVLGVFMLVPGFVDVAAGDSDWRGFFIAGAGTSIVGLLFLLANREERITLNRRQAFVLTVLSWLLVAACSAVPFFFSRLNISYTDAFFEAISGLTTTGSTVLTGLDTAPPGILLWRSLLHWLGGVGIVMMALALLPFLRVGGMQLFRMESSDTQEKVVARVNQLGLGVVAVYVVMTILCTLAYVIGGMTVFEAVNHAMATVSTGGYSTSDQSMGHFDSKFILWVAIIFMGLGSLPFTLYLQVARGNVSALYRNIQVRSFVAFISIVSVLMACWLWWTRGMEPFDALTHVAFNVMSVVSTTGFASLDYTLWGPLAVASFFALTFVGGCTGSTAGGIKIFRFQIAWRLYRTHIHRLISPNVVDVPRYGDRKLDVDVGGSVLIFFFVYIGTVGVITLFLALVGLDWVTAVSGAATAVGNVGPGLGDVIGPAGNFKTLPDSAKWALALGMLLGRLEFFTVLVLAMPRFWRT